MVFLSVIGLPSSSYRNIVTMFCFVFFIGVIKLRKFIVP